MPDLVFDIHPAFLVAVPLWLLFAWGAGVIARNRGEAPWRWVVLGLLIGPFSWLAARYSGKICLHCRSRINRLAIVCPHCQRTQTLSGAATGDLGARPESLLATDNLD